MVIFHGKLLVITRWYSGYFQRNLRVLFSRDIPRRIEVEAVAFMADLLFGKAGQKKKHGKEPGERINLNQKPQPEAVAKAVS